ncbi:MAG: hypothetical protein NVSMB7_16910 [Chitinophagaceae bacterium]
MNLTSIYYLHEVGGKKNQEDYIWPAPGTAVPDNKIFIVCDGVGGSENGEIASRMIAEYTGNTLLKTPPKDISLPYINDLLAHAKKNLVTHAIAGGLNKDMATTFTLLILFSNKAFIAWCGDSRVYHIRNGKILYKTSDHSLVNTLVKNGEITEQDALLHPQKHIILKAITGDDTAPDAEGHWINDIAGGDYFMLCTDGLLENISDDELTAMLVAHTNGNADPSAAMQEKCLGKTRDNYSMYLVQTGLQPQNNVPKTKKGYSTLWLVILGLIVVAAGLYFFNKKDNNTETVPAAAAPDSVVAPADKTAVKKDTVLQPGKSSLPDSELIKEEAGEKKIVPDPLPETKPLTDSPVHKKPVRRHAAGAVQSTPGNTIKNNLPVQKADSSLKQDQPLK